ncbi:Aldo/keto reductase [Gonapodya prolifera JEL478]|uniref:Aldo/keto reductase n=1 Tax=Gonapodya prolifera (strain JEL478) TaxID=1344416 RepID=A0A139AGG2_GONPJ|nr:Aldo/keto reductase [Gonapodya prolifera JEL478]|eukprot:KXS15503.1 Aldo/keto reductase [Gonapodya prolifera JEL478]
MPAPKGDFELPEISFGAATFGGVYGGFSESDAAAVCERALENGINHFDTAPLYGDSQRILGAALRQIARRWPREKYTISTKVGRYDKYDCDYSIPRIHESIANSLKLLGTDYIDIIVGHDVEFNDEDSVVAALKVLFDYKDKGTIRKVAISGYPLGKLLRIAQRCQAENGRPLDVMFSYCQLNLHSQRLLQFAPQFREAGIKTIVNLSPLSMGLFRPQGPPDWHYASTELRAACSNVRSLCASRGVSVAVLAGKYALHKGQTADPEGKPWITTTVLGLSKTNEVDDAVQLLGKGKEYTDLEREVLKEVEGIMAPFHNFEWVEVLTKPE